HVKCAPSAVATYGGNGDAHLTIQGIGTPSRSEPFERSWSAAERGWAAANRSTSTAISRWRRSRSRCGARASVTDPSDDGWVALRMACRRRGPGGHPATRDAGIAGCETRVGGSVRAAGVAADVTGGDAGLGVQLEEARAPVGAAEWSVGAGL